jgi:hypothetical protein
MKLDTVFSVFSRANEQEQIANTILKSKPGVWSDLLWK